jgi:hypothetical protein
VAYTDYKKLRKSQGKLSGFFKTFPLAGADLTREIERG